MGATECPHRKWIIDAVTNIGTCVGMPGSPGCGEVRQFPWDKGEPVVILKKGKYPGSAREKEDKMAKGVNPYERHRYYEEHKEEILLDITAIGAKATRKKWKIPLTSFS